MKLREPVVSHTLDIESVRNGCWQADLDLITQLKRMLSKLEIDMSLLEAVRTLGWGAFGVVNLMKNSKGEQFAVKVFGRLPHIDEKLLSASFVRESKALFSLRHPCVIPLYAFSRGREEALAMKYMEMDHCIGCPTSSVTQANLTIKINFNILRSFSSFNILTIYLHAFL
jgi:serine/threonine protein kinase